MKFILEKVGLLDQFGAVVGGDDVERGKPDPSIFQTAAERIGLTSADCAVVEDAISGVRAAKAGGFFCLGVDRVDDPDRLRGADLITGDLGEISLATLVQAFTARDAAE